jgi:hypothetical protein
MLWQSEIVDALADQSDIALRLDSDGSTHIAYRRANRAWYAHKQAGHWTIERIPYSAFPEVVVVDVALVIDEAGIPRVAFASNDQSDEIHGPGDLVYATKLGGSWTVTRVEACDAYGYDTGGIAVALDSQECPAIAYGGMWPWCGGEGMHYVYRYNNCSNWADSGLPVASGTFNSASLAFDSNDAPHLCFSYTSGPMKYAVKSTSWAVESVGPDSQGATQHGSLVLDSSGNPHISYYRATGTDVAYAVKTGGQWEIEVVESEGNTQALARSLALDVLGEPHICYLKELLGNRDLRYARRSGGTWILADVDTVVGSPAVFSAIGLTQSGSPRIAYISPGGLRFAWLSELTDVATDAGFEASGTFDALRVRPNPSRRGNTEFLYAVTSAQSVTLQVCDVSGRILRRLVVGSPSQRVGSVAWDGRDDQGRDVAAGTYFVRLVSGRDQEITKRFTLIR